jgi:hypothetical protein
MIEQILIGKGDEIEELPRAEWEAMVRATPEHAQSRLAFMTQDHHQVRNMAVLDLPRVGHPLTPEHFATRLDLGFDRVVEVLDELERKLFFLVRNEAGCVPWAYPVTVDRTPHQLTFSTGERLYGA